VIDSQSVKAPAAQARGYDAGKKIHRRKSDITVAPAVEQASLLIDASSLTKPPIAMKP
jgi:hypothetical protein